MMVWIWKIFSQYKVSYFMFFFFERSAKNFIHNNWRPLLCSGNLSWLAASKFQANELHIGFNWLKAFFLFSFFGSSPITDSPNQPMSKLQKYVIEVHSWQKVKTFHQGKFDKQHKKTKTVVKIWFTKKANVTKWISYS